ncbi:MAG: hypothetical protein EOR02_13230 [Mesorhizobium sp.]|nr:MAG: hypothetical protein EOR02_13230 [Mesorhizobium sp.]
MENFGEIADDPDAIKKLCDRPGVPASRWRFAIRPARAVMAARKPFTLDCRNNALTKIHRRRYHPGWSPSKHEL